MVKRDEIPDAARERGRAGRGQTRYRSIATSIAHIFTTGHDSTLFFPNRLAA